MLLPSVLVIYLVLSDASDNPPDVAPEQLVNSSNNPAETSEAMMDSPVVEAPIDSFPKIYTVCILEMNKMF